MMISKIGLYEVLGLEKTASSTDIKKAYYRLALIHHPDRSGNAQEFQQIGRAYEILSNESTRRLYDETGVLPEDDSNFADLQERFKSMFARVTKADIDQFKRQYVGSAEELEDLYAAYVKYKGSLADVSNAMFFGNAGEEPRYRQLFQRAIQRGILAPQGDMLVNEKQFLKDLKKREKIQAREAVEAEAYANSLHIDTKADLAALIQGRQKDRADSFLNGLEEKYGKRLKKK